MEFNTRIVFCAGYNMPGYVPESEPAQFDSFEEARDYILDELAFELAGEEDRLACDVPADERRDCIAYMQQLEETIESTRSLRTPFTLNVGKWAYWVEQATVERDLRRYQGPSRKLAKKCARILRDHNDKLNVGLEDPMTQAMHASEFVWQSFRDSLNKKLREIGMGQEQAREAVWEYSSALRRNLRNKKPHLFEPMRLAWYAQHSANRERAAQIAAMGDMAF